ncbi:MAG: hypothetical protein H7276_19575 [Caulobacter sp.]|nr:hypothetical protein [Vitreoscilla sp.]
MNSQPRFANRPLKPALVLCALLTCAGVARAQDAASLHARFDALQDKLAHNPYGRPLVLQSTQSSDHLEGEVYARVDQPYAMVQKALDGPQNWCGILILHLNVKMCHAQAAGLDMALGRKYDQPVDDAYKLHFDYKSAVNGADYLKTELTSGDGPLGTRDYRIAVEAAPLAAAHTMLHMSYAYGFGFTARVAMNAYLATAGSDKVGFSVAGKDNDGKPTYVGGVRGLVERNTMRYYLAIDDYVAAPAPAQLEQRLNAWFDATERYPRQLHEMEKNDYLTMKRDEAKR